MGRGADAGGRVAAAVRVVCEHVFVHLTNHKGNVAEAMIAAHATKAGVPVFRPLVEHLRYDLVFHLGGRFLRVQCKWASRAGDVIVVKLASNRIGTRGRITTVYSQAEIDLVAAYCADSDGCYLLPAPLFDGKRTVQLRLAPPQNGQRAALHWAADYELPGAIAQLGERPAGSRKVGGSSPPSSIAPDGAEVVGAHQFRNLFGYYLERAAAGEEILVTRRGKPHVRLGPARRATPL